MNTQAKPREFPLPSSVKVIPGTETAQAAYPYHIQFTQADDQKFWFYNSMHFHSRRGDPVRNRSIRPADGADFEVRDGAQRIAGAHP